MTCPKCGRSYHLKNYPFDEVYFECEKCEVELALSETELFAVNPRRVRQTESVVLSEALVLEQSAFPRADRMLSSKPLTLWVVLLSIFILVGTVSAVRGFMRGNIASGVVTLLVDWLLLFPAAVGCSLRRKFGFKLSFLFLALSLFGCASMVFGIDDDADRLAGARVLGGVFLGIVTLAWFLWFAQNTDLFSSPAARQDLNGQGVPPSPE